LKFSENDQKLLAKSNQLLNVYSSVGDKIFFRAKSMIFCLIGSTN
jgi:hypothetical protein